MNQNVSNSGSWLKLMGTEAKTEKLNTSRSGVQTAFSSFLSNQLSKSNNLMGAASANTQKDMAVSNENAKSLLKKVEPTANKLAVKSPERLSPPETKVQSQEAVGVDEKNLGTASESSMSNVEVSAKPTETTVLDQVEPEPTIVDDNVVNMEEVAALLQQLMANLIDLVKETPDVNLKQPLQEQIQILSNLLNEVNQMKDMKIDTETFSRAKSTIENILMSASKGEKVPPVMLENLKQTLKEIQSKNSDNHNSQFSTVLESKQTEVAQSAHQSAPTTPIESSVNSNTTAKMTGEAAQSTPEKKESVDVQVKSTGTGKEKLDVKVQTVDHKASPTPVNTDFNAKLESASIAFSKVEVANQTSRVPLQQSIMDQLINSPRMQVKQTEQGTMMTMKLNPEVLGDVEIKMEIVKGVLQAEIKVESMIVKGAIEAGLSDLKNALSDKGYQVESLNVSVGKDGQFQQGQQQQQQNERQGRLIMDELELEKGTYGFETVINDNQIDYRG